MSLTAALVFMANKSVWSRSHNSQVKAVSNRLKLHVANPERLSISHRQATCHCVNAMPSNKKWRISTEHKTKQNPKQKKSSHSANVRLRAKKQLFIQILFIRGDISSTNFSRALGVEPMICPDVTRFPYERKWPYDRVCYGAPSRKFGQKSPFPAHFSWFLI